jgi:ubiquinone/menaquinone biosynthesis C-methylase UbiE/glycosyltransferase involved in cell wall biosynthesis
MRLNWFSPLPPAKSGIADYTLRLLPSLCEVAEIVLWTDQDDWDPALTQFAAVRRYQLKALPWAEVNRGTMNVYHLGNNHRYHGHIWQVSRRHPGVVILHDTALQQFFAGLFREQWHDRAGYLALMERYYGAVGRQDAEDFWVGRLTIDYMVHQYRLTPFALENALGGLVHSRRGLEELTRESPCPLAYAPLPYPSSPRSHLGDGQVTDRNIGGPPYRLIVFGHISDNRRVNSLLQALASLPERQLFRLDIYGELWDRERITRHLELLELQGLVRLHGFVPAEELEAALSTAHLALNLRFPSMGEASVSQLQIWDHALPSLVTKVGWYAGLPEGTVAFVRPDSEVLDIQAHLQAFLADPGRFAKMGEQGRRTLESRHTAGAYAQAIVNLVEDARAFRPHAVAYGMARRVGEEVCLWSNLPASDVGAHLRKQFVGLSSAPTEAPRSIDGVDYRHLEALKSFQAMLSEQARRLERQFTMELRDLRRAASEEWYIPPKPQGSAVEIAPSAAVVARPSESADSMAAGEPMLEAPAGFPERELTSPAQVDSAGCDANRSPTVVSPHAMEGGGPKKSYTREDALRFPLSIEAHDTGFRYLFNFMVIARSLGLRPGDHVLDFGAGSCFVSELLNRFGYVTVAFDIDPEILAIGRDRLALDPRCSHERSRFVAGDGMRLPFRDERFDGVICMNALHHMADYHATLAEMCRVLKPGGRAVFAEPGDQHSKSPESILAMEQYGALEKDVVLAEIYQLARAVGFRRMALKPYVLPEMVDLDYEEFDRFREGKKVSGAFLTAPEVVDFLKGQPLFYLEKGGTKLLTSASAPSALLQAKLIIKECPSRVRQGGSLKVAALCENVGQPTWLAKPTPFGGYVTFGVKLLTADGRVLEDSRGRQRLSCDVPPGGRIEVVTEVSLAGLQPGSYRVLFDMVNELVCWFQSVGSAVVERWIEIV